jgi:hypothetical protein
LFFGIQYCIKPTRRNTEDDLNFFEDERCLGLPPNILPTILQTGRWTLALITLILQNKIGKFDFRINFASKLKISVKIIRFVISTIEDWQDFLVWSKFEKSIKLEQKTFRTLWEDWSILRP